MAQHNHLEIKTETFKKKKREKKERFKLVSAFLISMR